MEYEQVKQPNLSIVGENGECLVYVREVFGAAAKYPTAASGWTNASYKHVGSTPPATVAVPVWFSWETDGHVAVSVPGKGIYSTTAQGDKVFASIDALMAYIGGGIEYLGWSEDVDAVRVVDEVAAPTPAPTSSSAGKSINLPVSSGAWHLYKVGGPYNPNVTADVTAVVHPADYAPGGLTYPIVEQLADGVVRIQSPEHGTADLWTNGSEFTIS